MKTDEVKKIGDPKRPFAYPGAKNYEGPGPKRKLPFKVPVERVYDIEDIKKAITVVEPIVDFKVQPKAENPIIPEPEPESPTPHPESYRNKLDLQVAMFSTDIIEKPPFNV